MPIADTLRYNGLLLRRYVITDPDYPDPFPPGESIAAQPSSIVQLDPKLGIPYTILFGGGLERQLWKSTVSLMYAGSRGVGVFRSRDINAPLPPFYEARPDSVLGQVRQIEAAGRLARNALELSWRATSPGSSTAWRSTPLSKTYNNTGGIGYFPANMYDLSGEWGRANFDQRHRCNLLGTLTPGKSFNFGASLSCASALPYTVTTRRDDYHTGLGNARPAGVPRNSLEGAPYAVLICEYQPDFFLTKSKRTKAPQQRWRSTRNITNRVNYMTYAGTLTRPSASRSAFPA
jgi:hypothetical protein